MAPFEVGRPEAGYYNDLTVEVRAHASDPEAAERRLEQLTADPRRINWVTVAQLGLGAWQLGWEAIADGAASAVADSLGRQGALAYGFPMPHTYELEPPWSSAMAQGQAASLLVRTGRSHAALLAVQPLIDEVSPLVAATDDGPVLQEYPTLPPAHVLNGWIFALWGLYDVGSAIGDGAAADAWETGLRTLARRLPLYEVPGRWSRYDLYPHPLAHVASPFYHRLHVEQLRALDRLARDEAFARYAHRWASAARSPVLLAAAVGRKAAFRALRPRRPVT